MKISGAEGRTDASMLILPRADRVAFHSSRSIAAPRTVTVPRGR
jgi:hypothetical protein